MYKNLFALGILSLLLVLVTVFVVPVSPSAIASNPPINGEFKGWAWSSNTGWIAFNCSDEASVPGFSGTPCVTSNYAVSIASTDSGGNSTLTGWAWSSNVGWVTFKSTGGDDLQGCPAAPCVAILKAADVNGVRQLTGWARAIAPNSSGVSGWDGWISLSPKTSLGDTDDYDPTASCLLPPAGGTLGCYGPRMAIGNKKFTGFAWGGPVMGWIDFSAGDLNKAVQLVAPTVTVNLSADRTAAFFGESVTLTWTSANATSCVPSSGGKNAAWDGSGAAINASISGGNLSIPVGSTPDTIPFKLTCDGVDSPIVNVSVGDPNGSGNFNLNLTSTNLSASFVSNKQEKTTQTTVALQGDAGFSGNVDLSLVNPNPGDPDLQGAQVTAEFADSNLGNGENTTMRIVFSRAVAAKTYTFKVRATQGTEFKDKPFTVRVQSFIPAFKEQ